MTDYIRFCPHCHLQYRPDERIYKNASEVCPKCGYRLIPESEDNENEQSD